MNAKIVVITDRRVFPKEERTILSQKDKNIIWVDLFNAHKLTGNIGIKKTDDYLNRELYEHIDEGATYFAQYWTQIGNQNVSRYNSICLSELVEFDALLFYIKVLKNLELFQQIILKESPDEIILISDDELLKNILLLIGKEQNIKVKIVSRLFFRIKNKMDNYFRYLIEKYKIDIKKILFLLVRIKNLKIKNMVLVKANSKKPCFFIDNHRVIQPIVEKVFKEEKANIIFFNINFRVFERYIKKNYPISMFFEFKTKKDIRKIIMKNQKKFISIWNKLINDEEFKNKFFYRNIFLWDIIKEKLKYFWTKRFKWGIKNIEIIKQMMREHNVKATLVWHDFLEPGRTMVSVSNQLNVSSILIQDGIYAGRIGVSERLYADKVAVWGQATKDRLIKRGNLKSKIFVTGNPAYDKLINMVTKPKESKEKIIVFATQMIDYYSTIITDTNEEIIDSLYFAIKRIPNTKLLIKVHPGEKVKKYKDLIRNKNYKNIQVIKKVDLFDILKKCSVLVTHSSTVALEAMIVNKPVIIVNLTGFPDVFPYVKSGAALGVYKKRDLYPTIMSILNSRELQDELKNKRGKFIEKIVVLDGKATIRVSDLLFNGMN
jgi:hypothetical protein